MIFTRRQFLHSFSIPLLGLGMQASDASTQQHNNEIHNSTESKCVHECGLVYKEWIMKESASPAQYLKQQMKRYNFESFELSKAIELDFRGNETLVVQGLVLSKSEAALISLIYIDNI